jgi:hypothetical protein
MNRLRFACAAFAVWMFVFFNLERFHEPLNIASFVYVLTAVVAALIVGVKPLGTAPFQFLVSVPLLAYLLLKTYWGHPLLGQALPFTVVEAGAVAATVALAHQIAARMHGIETVSAAMITEDFGRQPVSLETAQSAMYREVRRARQHDRPLAVLAVASTGQSANATQERLLRELERELPDKYTNARIADLLAKEARDHGIVTQCNRHFLVLLPETDRLAAEEIVRQLDSTVKSSLGLKLRVGLSTFPDEEVTLVGLLQRAESAMRDRHNGERRQLEQPASHATSGEAAAAAPANREKSADYAATHDTVEMDDLSVRDTQEVITTPAPRAVRLPA